MGEVVPAHTSPTLHPQSPHCASIVATSTLKVLQTILVNCISSVGKNFMQLSNICNYQYFIFRWFDCHVCSSSPSNTKMTRIAFVQPTLSTEISQSKKKLASLCKTPLSYITPMHTLPLFCPTPCMPSPYSVPPHAYPPPILSRPTPCIPSPYPIPPHACPPPILSRPCTPSPYSIPTMHDLPLFCPTPCIPSPYSIPAHAYPPPILSQPMHTIPLFYSTPYIPSPYSIPL